MRIIEYRNCMDIDIEFENNYISKNKTYNSFKNKEIKNPYYPSVYGIGYVGEGKYSPCKNNKHTIQYQIWHSIMQRCYDEKFKSKRKSYKECALCGEWEYFQNFGQWYDENYYTVENEKITIDKDIIKKDNKLYSPETCVFVPERINMLFVKSNNSRGQYPIGVTWNKRDKIFQSRLNKNNNYVTLGYYSTPEKSFEVYKQEKEKYIKEIADSYKEKIPQKLYDAMYKYEVEITD